MLLLLDALFFGLDVTGILSCLNCISLWLATSRIEVNHDGYGGTAPDAMTWDEGGILKPRASSLRVTIDHTSLPGPPGFLESSWCSLTDSPITQKDVAVWPNSGHAALASEHC